MSTHDHVARDALRYNLVFRRAKLRLSQSTLAERAVISRTLVSDIEQGHANITLDVLERLAAALESTASKLIAPIRRGSSDADIARRRGDGPDAFVDGRDFLAALDEVNGSPAGAKPAKTYSKRGRKPAVPA